MSPILWLPPKPSSPGPSASPPAESAYRRRAHLHRHEPPPSRDYSGADALARAHHRAIASGTELRLAVTADAVRRVLTLNGFDRLIPVYPDLDAAAAGAGRREPRTRPADPAARAEELLDGTAAGISDVGSILQDAIDLPPDVTAQRITQALRRLDDIAREIHDPLLAERGQDSEPGLTWSPPSAP